ncbi:MAG: MaoC/PaaZ C-terminal domain-containing protein [Myxococcota bacterium]
MPLRLDAIGATTEPLVHEYRARDTILYALGCGAKQSELGYLYEGMGPQVLPTYAVVPGFDACFRLMDTLGGDLTGVVHGGQRVEWHHPVPPQGRLSTVGTVEGLFDLKRLATADIKTETRDDAGVLVAETRWQIIFRLDGGFGGPKPPRKPRIQLPERSPDFRVEETTAPEQALLYRLSGDHNPLHADPEVARLAGFEKPILHGLCTYGFVGRALIREACSGDPRKLRALEGQFRAPVFPGDTLVTEGWEVDNRWLIRSTTKERPNEHAFTNAFAELS